MSKHLKILLGGSPCTYWSISQSSDKRETTASGIGWELFKNFLIAKEKFKPDYFLYENNKSMAKPIRNQIDIEFNHTYAENTNWELISSVEEDKGHTKRWLWRNKTTGKTEYITRILINSALVSAQNRQRYYWTNIPNVAQPADRGILLKDILESGVDLSQNEKGYALTTRCQGAIPEDTIQKHRHSMVAEPIRIPPYGNNTKSRPVEALYANHAGTGEGSLEKRLCSDNKNKQQVDLIAEPIRVGSLPRPNGELSESQAMRIYSVDGKSVAQSAQGGGMGGKTGLYACPVEYLDYTPRKNSHIVINENAIRCSQDKNNASVAESFVNFPDRKIGTLTTAHVPKCIEPALYHPNGKPIYQVQNGLITIKDKQYPIKLPDGFYIIRKLTVNECRRLQTIPDWYKMPCSASQNYKMLGNGWTVEVIKHILSYIPDIKDCTVEVLSMYDGMSCGQITLAELGCKIDRYVSYEIDKYAIQTTQANFPNTEQRGDAFQLRDTKWSF